MTKHAWLVVDVLNPRCLSRLVLETNFLIPTLVDPVLFQITVKWVLVEELVPLVLMALS